MSKLPKHLLGLEKSQLESMCLDCGLCCYASVPFGKGNVLVPELRCKHLAVEKGGKSCCSVYEDRHDVAKGWCLPLADAIEKGAFPEQCPYVADMKDYVGSAVVTDATYQSIKPQLAKAISQEGKPEWAADSHWDSFLAKAGGHKYIKREGSPGNYTYTYPDDEEKPKKKAKKKDERVNVWGDLSLDSVKQWRSDMRKMSKAYRSIKMPGLDASSEEKEAFEKDFTKMRKHFTKFTSSLEKWGQNHLLDVGEDDATRSFINSAFWTLNENYDLFPHTWSVKTDTYVPNSVEMKHRGEKALRKVQKKVKAALDAAERHIANREASNETTRIPTATVERRGVNFVVHGRGRLGRDRDQEYRQKKLDDTIRNFDRVADQFKELGISKVLEGLTVHVHSENAEEISNDILSMKGLIAGFYAYAKDELRLLPFGHDELNDTLVHELGHRAYYKLMDNKARAAWKEAADVNRIKIERNHIDQFVEKFVVSSTYEGSDGEQWWDRDKVKAAVSADTSEDRRVYEHFAESLPGYGAGRTAEGVRDHFNKFFEEDEYVNREYVSDYAATNAEELFAEAFKHYVQKGPGSVPEWTRKQLREAMRAGGVPFSKSNLGELLAQLLQKGG